MAPALSPSSDPAGKAPAADRPLRVLVVEDERDTALTLVTLLRDHNHEAKAAYTVGQVWNILGGFNPDVVLIDIGLPDGSGYELAQKMRARFGDDWPHLIAVTAWNKGSDKILAQMAGFNEHVGKPYDPNHLLQLVGLVKPRLQN